MLRIPLIAALLLALVFAGCHAPDEDPTGDDNGTTGDGNGTPGPSHVEAVRLLSRPDGPVTASAEVEICWEVEGEGTIPHTAVHWDNRSHAAEQVTFQAYAMGVRYPGGAASSDPAGYVVPAEFCTTFEMPNQTIYLIAHAFGAGEAPGVISAETVIVVESEGTSATAVELRNFAYDPSSVTVDAGSTVTWTNRDQVAHTVTSGTGAFSSGSLGNGQTFSHTFDTAGSFGYDCDFHPSMTGTVVVQ